MARRKKNNRRRRRGSFAALYRLLCLALIVGAVAAALALFFKVEHIVVTGRKFTEPIHLVLGQKSCMDLIDPQLLTDALCRRLPVTGQHHRLDPLGFQQIHCLLCFLTNFITDGNVT